MRRRGAQSEFQAELFGGAAIVDQPPFQAAGQSIETVRYLIVQSHEVGHRHTMRHQMIGDEASVTIPGKAFRAQQGRGPLAGVSKQLLDSVQEQSAAHMIGVTAQTGAV